MSEKNISIALLDMYEGAPNEGMRCIKEIIEIFCSKHQITSTIEVYPVRDHLMLPGLKHDLYISSGGPGSPLVEDEDWIRPYFNWIEALVIYNQTHQQKKPVFFICYSFQMACRFFNIGKISRRHQTSFGIFPVNIAKQDHELLKNLSNPFHVFDNRDFQVIIENEKELQSATQIIALENKGSQENHLAAVMAIQFNNSMWGTQFHPEADALGMMQYLQREERKQQIIQMHGEQKWAEMMHHAQNPEALETTRQNILPNFLEIGVTYPYDQL